MSDFDRDAILARRAMFISAALAGLACTSPWAELEAQAPTQPEAPSEPETSAQPEGPVEPESEPYFPPRDESLRGAGPRPLWSEVIANVPPLDVPEHLELSEAERDRLQWLAEAERERYERIAPHWDLLPTPDSKSCEDWTEARMQVAALLAKRGSCGPGLTATHTLMERYRLHTQYVEELAEFVLPEFDAALDSTCPDDRRIRRLPRVCLSCIGREAKPIIAALSFGAQDAALMNDEASAQVLELVRATHESNRREGVRLVVRGHADPGEPEPEALARARAEAVVARLVELGLAEHELDVRAFAAQLPVTRDPTRAALNRRVDFELDLSGYEGY